MSLIRVKQTCRSMCADRLYTIIDEAEYEMKVQRQDGEYVHIYFIPHEKLNMSIIKYYYTLLYKYNIKHTILIYKAHITSSVQKMINNHHNIKIELFCMNELTYNITKHHLVPQHIRVDPEPNTDITKYPILKKTDPVVRYYGYASGDLIKILRKDGSIYFRVVK